MNKSVFFLIMATLTAPLFAADVDFTGQSNLDGTVTITYAVNNGTIRGMALNVDATAPLTFVDVDTYWDVFMDAAYMDPHTYEIGDGSPICHQDQPGTENVDMAAFCLSMGNLEGVAAQNAIILSVPPNTEFILSLNSLRGGVVNTDGVAMTTNLPISFTPIPPTLCLGDVTKDGKVSIADMSAIVAFLSPDYAETDPPYTADPTPANMINADVNEDGKVSIADMAAIVAFLSPEFAQTDPPYTYEGCMPSED